MSLFLFLTLLSWVVSGPNLHNNVLSDRCLWLSCKLDALLASSSTMQHVCIGYIQFRVKHNNTLSSLVVRLFFLRRSFAFATFAAVAANLFGFAALARPAACRMMCAQFGISGSQGCYDRDATRFLPEDLAALQLFCDRPAPPPPTPTRPPNIAYTSHLPL